MNNIQFAIIGGGWRTEFYIRIAKLLPHLFKINSIYIRNVQKAKEFQEKWDVPVTSSIDDLIINQQLQFIVMCISKTNATSELLKLGQLNIPILAETPPAVTIEEIKSLYQYRNELKHIAIAEQYIEQPLHASRMKLIKSGLIGEVNHAQVSVAHGYHGINLIRAWLGIGHEACTIIGTKVNDPVVEGPTRHTLPSEHRIVTPQQELAILQFANGKSSFFDFCREQYFSPIRSPRLLIRGTKGEIVSEQVNWTSVPAQYSSSEILPKVSGLRGELRPLSLEGVQFQGEWLYRNPFFPAALTEEEIAIAHTLVNMSKFVTEGDVFYTLEDALLDTYLAIKIEQAIELKQAVIADFAAEIKSN